MIKLEEFKEKPLGLCHLGRVGGETSQIEQSLGGIYIMIIPPFHLFRLAGGRPGLLTMIIRTHSGI